ARNPRYIDKNFGAMLCVWDRLFGTHVELDPDEPPVYGAHSGYETHDGALSQWVLWRDLSARCRRAGTLRDKVRVLTSRPAWAPRPCAWPGRGRLSCAAGDAGDPAPQRRRCAATARRTTRLTLPAATMSLRQAPAMVSTWCETSTETIS